MGLMQFVLNKCGRIKYDLSNLFELLNTASVSHWWLKTFAQHEVFSVNDSTSEDPPGPLCFTVRFLPAPVCSRLEASLTSG